MLQTLAKILADNYFIVIYGIALILSIIRYQSYFDTALKYFPIIIVYTLFNEVLGVLIKNIDEFQFVFIERYSFYNVILYNLYFFIFYMFFYLVYLKQIKKEQHKKIIKVGIALFIIVSLISLLFQDPMLIPLYYSYGTGALVLILSIIFYFRMIFSEKENPYKLRHNLLFWVSFGLLIFYSIDPILMILGLKNEQLYVQYNLHTLLYSLIIIMYTLFCVGFSISNKRAFR